MSALNYRHSLNTLNKHLEKKHHSVAFFMQEGKPTYQFFEKKDGKNVTCGWAYSATDAADITNKICKLQ